jgi:hypothetical protein
MIIIKKKKNLEDGVLDLPSIFLWMEMLKSKYT